MNRSRRETAICRENGGGGNRTRETFPPEDDSEFTPAELRPAKRIKPNADDDWLYFVQPVDGGPIKVGRTRDPLRRLDQLQGGNHRQLRIIYACEGGGDLEAEIHEELAGYRIRGEWFKPHGPIHWLLAIGVPRATLRAAGVEIPPLAPVGTGRASLGGPE